MKNTPEVRVSDSERWCAIPGFEGVYEVSDLGRVKSLARVVPCKRHGSRRIRQRIRKLILSSNGYWSVGLHAGGSATTHSVHRLVLEAFVGPCIDGSECRHIDGNKGNNHLTNLCWGTPTENERDKIACGTVGRGQRNSNARLTEDEVRAIRRMRNAGHTYREVGEVFAVAPTTISSIVNGTSWAWLDAVNS